MSKLLIKNVELLHTPNGEMNYIAIEDDKIVYVGTEVPAAFEDAEIMHSFYEEHYIKRQRGEEK